MVCQLTPAQEARMYEILRGFADDPHALEMQQFVQPQCNFQIDRTLTHTIRRSRASILTAMSGIDHDCRAQRPCCTVDHYCGVIETGTEQR